MNKSYKEISNFIYTLNENDFKSSHFKTEIFKYTKYQIIQNFKNMIKTVKISVCIIILSCIALTIIGCKSNEADKLNKIEQKFNEYKELDKIKTDSFETIISDYKTTIWQMSDKCDSLRNYSKELKSQNDKLSKSNYNLHNVIKHQNQMIENLQKKLNK